MSSRRHHKYELIVECKAEWSSSYIFINKKYKFNIYLCDKNGATKRPLRTHSNSHSQTPLPPSTTNTNTADSETYTFTVTCLDNESKPLPHTEHTLTPSHTITLNKHTFHTFTVTIHKLSMNHGNSPFRLAFNCDNSRIDTSIANHRFISVRVINYKLQIAHTPKQLNTDHFKFYKDVKPKTNFLCYDIALYNASNKRCKPPRKVPIKCDIYFENGQKSPNQKALNLKGINSIYSEPYTLKESHVTVPLRIEETSTKYENKKFVIQFIADYEKITSNLDIAPVMSDPFLVRTKINKYRIRNKKSKNQKYIPSSDSLSGSESDSSNDCILPLKKPIKTDTNHSIPLLPMLNSYMPPLFATAPGMNSVQIDGEQSLSIPPLPPLPLPPLNLRKNKRKLAMDSKDLLPNKRQKIRHRPMTRSMTRNNGNHSNNNRSPTVSADSECESNNKYGFTIDSSDTELEPLIIESLSLLGECMGRREYFVSGTECHCYLKCLYCGVTAYPPKERHIKHMKSCLLWVLYQNMTRCTSPSLLAKAFDFDPSQIEKTVPKITKNVPNMSNIPPIPRSYLHKNNSVSISDINPNRSRRRDSNSFSLVRSDRCNSFNGFIGPFNSLLLPQTTPIPNLNNLSQNNNDTIRSRSDSFPFNGFGIGTQTPIPPLFGSFNGSVAGNNNGNGYDAFPANGDGNESVLNGLLKGFPSLQNNKSNLSLNSNLNRKYTQSPQSEHSEVKRPKFEQKTS